MGFEIVDSLLGRLISVGVVIFIACTAFKFSWSRYGAAKAAGVSGRAPQSITAGPIVMGAAAVTALVLTVVQILWLWTCYVIGNGWSYFLFHYLDEEIARSGGTRQVPSWKQATDSLDWDPFTIGYVGVCCLALVAAYAFLVNHPEQQNVRVIRPEHLRDGTLAAEDLAEEEAASATFGDGSGIFYLIMAPSLLLGAVAAVVTTLAAVTAFFDKMDGKEFTLGASGDNWASLAAALLITSLATGLVMQVPGVIFRAWRLTPK